MRTIELYQLGIKLEEQREALEAELAKLQDRLAANDAAIAAARNGKPLPRLVPAVPDALLSAVSPANIGRKHPVNLQQLVSAIGKGYTTPKQLYRVLHISKPTLKHYLVVGVREGAVVRLMRGRYGLPNSMTPKIDLNRPQVVKSARKGPYGYQGKHCAKGSHLAILADAVDLAGNRASLRALLTGLRNRGWPMTVHGLGRHLAKGAKEGLIKRLDRGFYADPHAK
jgi:hypothetical protein